MLIAEDGQWIGGISGGCLEGDTLRRAKMAILQNQPRLITYDTTEEDAYQIGIGLGCKGIIDVLIEPIDTTQLSIIDLLEKMVGHRETKVLATVFAVRDTEEIILGQHFWLEEGGQSLLPKLNQDMWEAQRAGRSVSKVYDLGEAGTCEVLLEVFPPDIQLLILGSNYDIHPLARMASELGWRVVVGGNLLKLGEPLRKVANQLIPTKTVNPFEVCSVDFRTAVLLMSHDYDTDCLQLPRALASSAPYIGILGPRKRTVRMEEDLNLSLDLKRVHSPIGLNLGANTPEEIALSILSEIQAFFTQADGSFLKNRKGSIH